MLSLEMIISYMHVGITQNAINGLKGTPIFYNSIRLEIFIY